MNNHDYFCFHDVDMVPVSGCDYSYTAYPTRLWSFLSPKDAKKFEKKRGVLKPVSFGGGVVLFTADDFKLLNGYSNNYWGWGPGDRDMFKRCLLHNLKLVQYRGIYNSLPHKTVICSQNKKTLKSENPTLLKNREYFGSVWGFVRNDDTHISIGRVGMKYLTEGFLNPDVVIGENDGRHPKNDGLNNLKYRIVKHTNKKDYEAFSVDLTNKE